MKERRQVNRPIIEGCVDGYGSAMAAARGGADRFELCGHLAIGGVTPSPVVFRQVARDSDVPINVLIRPRFGDFLYTETETEQMCREIELFRDMGANGVVIGALTPDGRLDEEKLGRMMSRAGDMELALHRAFDMTRDPFAALETAIDLGFDTILTSGQQANAELGQELLKELFAAADGRIDIMAGCGVKKHNIRPIHDYTGINVFHTTGRKGPADSGMVYRKTGVSMGLPYLSEYELWQTDEEEFRQCAQIVHGFDVS